MIDPATAQHIALDALIDGLRQQLEIVPVATISAGSAYGVDPVDWLLFMVKRKNQHHVGGSEFVAVHPTTGEVRMLGRFGE